jgi:hypothetical protein
MHYMAYISYQMKKHKFGVRCPNVFFVKFILVPPEHEWCHHFKYRMQRNALRSLRNAPNAKTHVRCNVSRCIFVESIPAPPEHEKKCVDVWHPGHTRMHYLTHRSNRMQTHKFGITCPGALFCQICTGPTRA